MRKFLFIIIFLCQHIAMASEAMVVHLPDDSHHFLVSVSQPHTHADLHHDHDDDTHHADESVQAGSTHGDSSGHSLKSVKSTTSTDATLNAASGHDSAAHEHVQHVHLVADLPAESSLTFCAPTQDDAYHYASQLTAITYSPPVPPPNA